MLKIDFSSQIQSWTKLLEKMFFINAHYLTQHNYFQINGFA